jgi:hypothetical protein
LIHRQTITDPRKDMCAAKYRRIAMHCVLSHEPSSHTKPLHLRKRDITGAHVGHWARNDDRKKEGGGSGPPPLSLWSRPTS